MLRVCAVGLATAILAAPPAFADDDAYGTASLTAHQVGSYQFQARDGSPLGNLNGNARFLTVAGVAIATPSLPSGVQVERVDLRGCDTDPAAQVSVSFAYCPTIGGNCALAGSVTTGVAATPGCTTFSTTLAAPVIVDHANQGIAINVSTGTTSATTFSSVNLYYRLRVSPAPSTATFPNDVPTSHPFFRFIEALAAAGITGGCGPGSFCPNAPVTRGEIAVFLSAALGLHFPN